MIGSGMPINHNRRPLPNVMDTLLLAEIAEITKAPDGFPPIRRQRVHSSTANRILIRCW